MFAFAFAWCRACALTSTEKSFSTKSLNLNTKGIYLFMKNAKALANTPTRFARRSTSDLASEIKKAVGGMQGDKTELMLNLIESNGNSKSNPFWRCRNASSNNGDRDNFELWEIDKRPCMTGWAKHKLNSLTGGKEVKDENGKVVDVVGGAYSANDFPRALNYVLAFAVWTDVKAKSGDDVWQWLSIDGDAANDAMRDGGKWVNNNVTRSTKETGGGGKKRTTNKVVVSITGVDRPKLPNGNTTDNQRKLARKFYQRIADHAIANYNNFSPDVPQELSAEWDV